MFVLRFALTTLSLLTALFSRGAEAIDFKSLECAPVTFQESKNYNVNIPCTAVVRRPGSGSWYNAPGRNCPTFCRAIASVNIQSPDGFSCTSGEERPWSAIGVINYAPTGCWHNCRFPEGRVGAVSVGARCYAPGQKRDNDRTDTTVGCFCATGDIDSNVVDIGIHTGGTAQSVGLSHSVSGLTDITAAAMNDRPGRVSYLRGGISLSGEAIVRLIVNIKGPCGTSIAMSGHATGSGGRTSSSNEIVIALPSCRAVCADGVDNDDDGGIDGVDFSCVASRGESEELPQSACQNGLDDDGDGAADEEDSGCDNAQDNSENGEEPTCEAPADHATDLIALEEIIRAQRMIIYGLIDPILSSPPDETSRAKGKEFRALADAIKRELVRDINRRYPKTTLQCENCLTQELSQIKRDFVSRSRRMLRLTKQVAAFARTVTPALAVRGPLQSAESLFQKFSSGVEALPSATSQCSMGEAG